jgi:SpoVK/Ycf46/Vps4 family AAA+-type ATPase
MIRSRLIWRRWLGRITAPRRWRDAWSGERTDARLARVIGRSWKSLHVHSKHLPGYRFVDVYQAVDAFCRHRGEVITIDSEHPHEDLNALVHAKPERWVSRRITTAGRASWAVGPGEEAYLPVDGFWLSRDGGEWLVLRVRYHALADRVFIEVATPTAAVAEAAVGDILARSAAASVYRNKIIAINFEAGIKDEYGDVERPDRLSVTFKTDEPVADDDIILDDEVRVMLWRNVVDLHHRRGLLKAHRVPVRRGVLLYGPPGTGKTFACRYLCGQLPETTRIIVAGTALLQVKSVFNLARLLQPAVVILEDVDLVFAARDITLHTATLGELLDQMDGLRPSEDIGVILTTNAVERVEAAIKDRPGRISQCIRFGPPNDPLRARYLGHHLRAYDTARLDLEALAGATRGATQAFLKEWVHRAVQMATERLGDAGEGLDLRGDDFDAALREMRRFSEGSAGRIIGFSDGGSRP